MTRCSSNARETDGQYIRDLIARIREGIPGIAIRPTFIIGFPGETKRFETLLDFIRATKFERLGVFAYSKEDGTRAGGMRGQIPVEQGCPLCEGNGGSAQNRARSGQALIGKKLNVLAEKLALIRICGGRCAFLGTRVDSRYQPPGT